MGASLAGVHAVHVRVYVLREPLGILEGDLGLDALLLVLPREEDDLLVDLPRVPDEEGDVLGDAPLVAEGLPPVARPLVADPEGDPPVQEGESLSRWERTS